MLPGLDQQHDHGEGQGDIEGRQQPAAGEKHGLDGSSMTFLARNPSASATPPATARLQLDTPTPMGQATPLPPRPQ